MDTHNRTNPRRRLVTRAQTGASVQPTGYPPGTDGRRPTGTYRLRPEAAAESAPSPLRCAAPRPARCATRQLRSFVPEPIASPAEAPPADPDAGARSRRARLDAGRRRRLAAGAGRGRGAPGGRGRATGRSVARRLRHEPRDASSPAPTGWRRSRSPRRWPSSSRARPPTIQRVDAGRDGRGGAARVPQHAPGRSGPRVDHRAEVLADPDGWGRVAPLGRRSVNVEFVSANPTGPLHIGNARGAFVGDLLCRVLEAGGQQVTREYYFNDSGGQIRNLGASVAALRRGDPVPDDGYKGDYVIDLAAALPDEVWAAATHARGRHRRDPSATGRRAGSARGSSAAWPPSASGSTSGPARRGCTTRAGSTARCSGCASTATSTSRTARSGSARPSSATTRTG